MSLALDSFTVLAVAAGGFFFLAGTVGLLRFPDSLTRLHALTKADNLGLGLVVLGLLPRADGSGLVLATEILTATPAVRRHVREGETHLLMSEMQTGRKHQMHTTDNSLLGLYQRGEITYDTAVSSAREPDTIRTRAGAAARDRRPEP